MSRDPGWLRRGLRNMGVPMPEDQIDVSGIPQHPAAGRNMQGDIGSETFTATGQAPQGPPDMIGLSQNNTLQFSTTTSDPSQLFQGGDSMFYNQGRQMPAFNVFGNQQMGPPLVGGQTGMPGFGDAVRGMGGLVGDIGGGIADAGKWVLNPDNAGTVNALANLAGVGANIYGARQEGAMMDEELRRQREREKRLREIRESMSPEIGRALRGAGGF